MSHGRAVTIEDCNACGLNIDVIEPDTELWKTVWHLYMRSKYVVDQTAAVKLLDTCDTNFTLTA
jgi:hypothetical protein